MELDWLAIVAATVVGMVVAGTWYGKAFTTLWSSLTGVAAADSQKASRRNMTQLLVANGMTAVGLTAGIKVTSMAVADLITADKVGVLGLHAYPAQRFRAEASTVDHAQQRLSARVVSRHGTDDRGDVDQWKSQSGPLGSMTNCSHSRVGSWTSTGTACITWTKARGRRYCSCTAIRPGRSTTAL